MDNKNMDSRVDLQIYLLDKIPDAFVNVLHSFLSDRQFRVKIDEIFSDWKMIKAGVPQGSFLRPILFNLYVNDLPASPGTKVAMYADDTAFLAQLWKPSLVSNRTKLKLGFQGGGGGSTHQSVQPSSSPKD
ncbi:hypothetical protein AAG570_008164 [Ranatra chinensis]|uniref:Reverse transcriptase domain-containing protein n=1 Tax=Ranatra chinensis TaxID=642074 RepID=A0ABD0XSD0_9HEMI